MTAPRKADVVAAERLLKAAVREARRLYITDTPSGRRGYNLPLMQKAVANLLAEATRSAELLLGEAS